MDHNTIAIACQGGGSQTAFTAGVLKCLFEKEIHRKKRVAALSGTSGGAVCAALSWYALIKDRGDPLAPGRRLTAFWKDNSTGNFFEDWCNDAMIGSLEATAAGWLPRWEIAPDSPLLLTMLGYLSATASNKNYYDFKGLLEAHLDFDEIRTWDLLQAPVLLIGAANVLSGEFVKFNSRKAQIQVEKLLASAAVPTIFPAVRIGKDAFWDGLFSDNPPTDELLYEEVVGSENKPDEIWIIQINPKERRTVPGRIQDILDRRNEMVGNASLGQDLQKIELINRLLAENAFMPSHRARYKPVVLRTITMSQAMHEELTYSTKLSRSRRFIEKLIHHGEERARAFLETL